jgi:glutamate dehydrogenase
MALKWKEALQAELIRKLGPQKGKTLSLKYKNAFPRSYQDDCNIKTAVRDIIQIEKLTTKKSLEMDFYELHHEKHWLHLRLVQLGTSIPLSDILPMLENMDLRTINERPYQIQLDSKATVSINDFDVVYNKETQLDFKKIKKIFREALVKIRFGLCENDGFNKLVLSAELTWREINILRSYAKYLHQTGFIFRQAYIEKTLSNNAGIAKDLVNLFITKFDPKHTALPTILLRLENKILKSLENVTSLDEDRVLRRLLDLIKATVRTNYFKTKANGNPKKYLSLKLNCQAIPELPLPYPLYEIFVHSPRFEAIHMRCEKVARGGIRWSDRPEDFRTEILGLMKAQKVKNAIIVPSGAKGGFVIKRSLPTHDRKAVETEVIYCYRAFIRGLLDLTDNIMHGKVVHPTNVVCYDEHDPYLVVAADKGTSEFSDTANKVAEDYDFWLGDAFASGGSEGYDHKKMGITARGAWESIRRHFQELNININNTPFTVVGIGDMSGDVFGNGMIYSDRIKLVAAFDHRHIFIDPNPDTKKSYQERVRLFQLTRSSWENYNSKLISRGGGVFNRSSKSITLSTEIKKLLNITESALPPNELIRALLKAPVDLLYNGGIGTYVKGSQESQADVGDKTNEFCRINGDELRCKIVAEGGNLGLTQLGRIEYALNGGLINTDFIDNSGGVDCSDHEVNIKILLDKEIAKNNLTLKKRNNLLARMTPQIAELVLKDNYNQALALSFSAQRAIQYVSLYQDYTSHLETMGVLNRSVECLPNDKIILERKANNQGFTRPELAALLAYTKIHVKREILKSDLPEDPFFANLLFGAFPKMLHSFRSMQQHILKREIIATQLSNSIINQMGITFIYRIQNETGAAIADIIRAHAMASHIFKTRELEQIIESLDFKVPFNIQYEALHNTRNLLNFSTRWFLRSAYIKKDITQTIERFAPHVKKLEKLLPTLMVGSVKTFLQQLKEKLMNAGVTKESARRIAGYRPLYSALNIIEVAAAHRFDLTNTAKVYLETLERFSLTWFYQQINEDIREGLWNNLARLTLRDELEATQKLLTIVILSQRDKKQGPNKLTKQWMTQHKAIIERWRKVLDTLHNTATMDYAMSFIALRELANWVQAASVT